MQMDFNGRLSVKIPPGSAADFLSGAGNIASCIPDTSDFKQTGDRSFSVKVRVGIGFFKGIFDMNGTVTESTPSRKAFSIEGHGVGSRVKIEVSMDISGGADASDISWNAVFEISGLVGGVEEGVIRKIGQDRIDEILANAKARMEGHMRK